MNSINKKIRAYHPNKKGHTYCPHCCKISCCCGYSRGLKCPKRPACLAGPPGPAGPAGAQGEAGVPGPAGTPGAIGPSGPAGPAGAQGEAGEPGPAGPTGASGAVGPSGPAGPAGAQGEAGEPGPTGATGAIGPAGPTGAQGEAGEPGPAGPTGPAGATGPAGTAGAQGEAGEPGPTGATGAIGPAGPAGVQGEAGESGPAGPQGEPGPAGPQGIQGPAGGVLAFADFFALMPPDNADTVAPGTDVDFPQDGPNSGTGIARTGPSSFNLTDIGFYQVLFQVSVTEAGQLILTLNGADLAYTVVGRATGTSQIVEMAIIETTSVNSILTVRNPAGNSTALTITPLAGGTRPVSAHLVITRLQ
ncbi:collagen-like triple helix repeat-containing protein [Oceanobacillus rekensis]|uniref:collagen-like triple helix repeat-containing protein n=1 Tax=Oceanobacillus rekensis TaxID=937927 RepID=UPI000B44B596|nr:collagen-like triple helix repeat-containing protein [Oceanobacillus rekensis]